MYAQKDHVMAIPNLIESWSGRSELPYKHSAKKTTTNTLPNDISSSNSITFSTELQLPELGPTMKNSVTSLLSITETSNLEVSENETTLI